jgi:hypothetical protein
VLASTHFLKLELLDAQGKAALVELLLARRAGLSGCFTDLNKLPKVALEAQIERKDADGKRRGDGHAAQSNEANIALMAHLQLRRAEVRRARAAGLLQRQLHVSLVPNESRTITIEADAKDFNGEDALVVVDGWNVTVAPASAAGVSIAPNIDAQPEHSPVTGLPFQTVGLRTSLEPLHHSWLWGSGCDCASCSRP